MISIRCWIKKSCSMLIDPPIPDMQLFQNLTLIIQGRGHGRGQSSKPKVYPASLLFHVNCLSHCWNTAFFKIWPWKFKCKVMGEVTVPSHKVCPTSYSFTSFSFRVNRPSHSWDTAFSKFDFENSRSRSWEMSKFKATNCVLLYIDSYPFSSMLIWLPINPYPIFSISPPIPEIQLFFLQNLTLKIQL